MVRRSGGQIDKDAILKKALVKDATLTVENAKLTEQLARLTDENASQSEQISRLADQNTRLADQNDRLVARVEELMLKVAELAGDRNQNSRNSNKPPSSDSLDERKKIRKKKRPSGRKRGGQKGHKGHYRELIPPDEIDRFVDLYPEQCEVCLQVPPRASVGYFRHQVVDLLEKSVRQVTEYRVHSVECDCGAHVTANQDEVVRSAFGPGLKSAVAMLTGTYEISRRQVAVLLRDMFDIKISLGSVSNIEGQMSAALAAPANEAKELFDAAAVKHIDETTWVRGFELCSVWVLACATVTVFRIVEDGRRATLLKILERRNRGILVSDRAAVFLFWSMQKRQVCWSHLQRAFIGFSQRDGPAGVLGKDLVTCAELVFGYWRQYCSGGLSRERFEQLMEAVREKTKQLLERAAKPGIAHVSGSCANMLKHWDAMWTFVNTPGVEPTNNHAERELRRLVMWRRRCFGTQSDRGDRFVERMMTVTHTLRKQGRRVLSFLRESLLAMLSATSAPRLVVS